MEFGIWDGAQDEGDDCAVVCAPAIEKEKKRAGDNDSPCTFYGPAGLCRANELLNVMGLLWCVMMADMHCGGGYGDCLC